MSTDFDLKDNNMPATSGIMLKVSAWIANTSIGKLAIQKSIKDLGLDELRTDLVSDSLTYLPYVAESEKVLDSITKTTAKDLDKLLDMETETDHLAPLSSIDFAKKYRSGEWNPVEVATFYLTKIKELRCLRPHAINAIYQVNEQDVLLAAEESRDRFISGTQLSILDGVPVVIKDELAVKGYKRSGNSSSYSKLHPEVATEDADAVRGLREMGAIILGKTAMHELGMGVTGFSANFEFGGTPRNPYNTAHYCGGSSSGSAFALASGIGCISLICDVTGSGRIPFGLCGVYGLKPTFNRISMKGALNVCPSMATLCVAGATVQDVIAGYVSCASAAPGKCIPDNFVNYTVPLSLHKFHDIADLSDLRVGIYQPFFDFANHIIVEQCSLVVEKLRARGAKIVNIFIPELLHVNLAQLSISISDISYYLSPFFETPSVHALNSPGISMIYQLGLNISGALYTRSVQQRTRTLRHMKQIFEQVDVILTPTTAMLAPIIAKNTFPHGESSPPVNDKLVRFIQLASLTGIPAMSVPIGYDLKSKLPIGIQIMAAWWREDVIFRAANAIQRETRRQRPDLYFGRDLKKKD